MKGEAPGTRLEACTFVIWVSQSSFNRSQSARQRTLKSKPRKTALIDDLAAFLFLLFLGVVTAVEKLGSSCHIHLSENTIRLAVNAHGTGEVQVFCELPQVKNENNGKT